MISESNAPTDPNTSERRGPRNKYKVEIQKTYKILSSKVPKNPPNWSYL
jgi:hypothetical protein